MLICPAALQNISSDYYDAAAVDGVNAWQRFTRITLPLLSPTLFFVITMYSIGALEAFTPLIPLNADDSGIPAAIIRYKVCNPTNSPVDVSVLGSLANAVGFKGYDVFNNLKLADEVVNEYREESDHRGLYYSAANLPEDDFHFGSMAILTTNEANITRPTWLHGQWTDNAQDFWDDFRDGGKLESVADIAASGSELLKFYDFSFLNLREKIGSLGNHQALNLGEETVFEFAIAWHFPQSTARLGGI